MNSEKLWGNRIQEQWKDYQKYLRYMFNDHLLIVLIFVVSGGAFQYQAWLKTLDPNFPAALILAILLSLFITRSRMATFLKEADRAFLLPAEVHMRKYFWRSGIYSFLFQSVVLLLVLLILFGIYLRVGGTYSFFSILLFILFLKALNIWVRWMVLKERGPGRTYSPIVRYGLNGVSLYFFLKGEILFTVIALGIFFVLTIVIFFNTRQKLLKWDDLIHDDAQRRYQFYRLANMFTDVPKLKSRVKRKRLLDFLLPSGKGKDSAYVYLFSRSYIRYGDFFGLTVRLTAIGYVVSYWIGSSWLMLITTIITSYLTGFQLIPLFKQNAYILWVRLYPVQAKLRVQAFIRFLTVILLVQLIVLSTVFLLQKEWLFWLISFLVGYIFIFFIMKTFILKRIQSETKIEL